MAFAVALPPSTGTNGSALPWRTTVGTFIEANFSVYHLQVLLQADGQILRDKSCDRIFVL